MIRHERRNLTLEQGRVALNDKHVVNLGLVVLVHNCGRESERKGQRKPRSGIRIGTRNTYERVVPRTTGIVVHLDFGAIVRDPGSDRDKVGDERGDKTLEESGIPVQHVLVDDARFVELVDHCKKDSAITTLGVGIKLNEWDLGLE